jgi:hypothetical protein
MATVFRALIRREDYETFRRILQSDLASTYDVWLNGRSDEATKAVRTGMIVKSVEVDPSEFAAWCAGNRSHPTIDDLDGFAFEKAKRKPDR